MIETTGEMLAAFRAEREDWCDEIGCGRDDCLTERLTAVLAIVERDLKPPPGPCAVSGPTFHVGQSLWCDLRHGHDGDHESGTTRWRYRS